MDSKHTEETRAALLAEIRLWLARVQGDRMTLLHARDLILDELDRVRPTFCETLGL